MARSAALVTTPPAGAVRVYRAARRGRRLIIAALLVAIAAGGAWMWFRSSSLVVVKQVRVTGVSGPESAQIRAALEEAADSQTTLHANEGALLKAVAGYPVVHAVHVSTSFPHRMTIAVVEQLPVAVLSAGHAHTAAAGDGVVLGSSEVSDSLPVLRDSHALPATGQAIHTSGLRNELTLLGAAPRPLDALVAKLFQGPEGLTAKMRDGLIVYFGDASRPHAKWLSLARVLADRSSAGARYIDVSLPDRPAAGMDLKPLQTVGRERSGSSALASSLDQAVGGEAVGEELVGAEEAPSEEAVEEVPAEAPVEEVPVEEAPAEVPVEEVPVEEAAVEEAPAEEVVEEAPIE